MLASAKPFFGRTIALFAFGLLVGPAIARAELLTSEHAGFSLLIDCDKRGAVLAHYRLGEDTGDHKRASKYHTDDNVPANCQQSATKSYKAPPRAKYKYDRGHLVPANHLDSDPETVKATNVMTNIVPQHRTLNRSGSWRESEKLIECLRESEPLDIWIGVVWGNDTSDDHFVRTHGIPTPDSFVKVVYRTQSQQAISWHIPNGPSPKDQLPSLIVTPAEAERTLGRVFELPGVDKTQLADPTQWEAPAGCDWR